MKSPEELQDLIHEVVPALPLAALELLEELGTIGEEAELAQELAHTLALVRRATPEPSISDGFADALMAVLPAGPPPVAGPSATVAAAPEFTPTPSALAEKSPLAGLAASFLVGVALTTAWGWSNPSLEAQVPAAQVPAAQVPAAQVPIGPDLDSAPESVAPSDLLPQDGSAEEGEGLGGGIVEAGHNPATPKAAPVDPALARLASQGDPVQSYVARASIVFEALERLDTQDPRVSRALALHLERTDLLQQGEQLLIAIEYDPAGGRLRPLIRGAQVVLRKVRHVPFPAPQVPAGSPGATPLEAASSLSAIRQEVRHTGLLAACRELLATPTERPRPSSARTRDL